MKKIAVGLLSLLLLAGCTKPEPKYEKFSGNFFGTFDTVVQLVAYTESQEEFDRYLKKLEETFQELHKDFDNYHTYEGMNNIMNINEQAGIAPVKVSDEMIELLTITEERYDTSSTKTDISNGALYAVWHKYREEGLDAPETAVLPPKEELDAAASHSGMQHIVIDEAAKTVFIDDKNVQMDLGAVAKGYATERAAKILEAEGLISGIVNSGGNIRTIGKPMDERDRWGIGIQHPDYLLGKTTDENIEVVYVANQSVVTSGDYQRFFTVDGKPYHHLIDPVTHMPADTFRSVSIVTEDSGLADFLSTAIFLMEYEEGRALVESLDGVEALWVFPDLTMQATDGMKAISYSHGAHATD